MSLIQVYANLVDVALVGLPSFTIPFPVLSFMVALLLVCLSVSRGQTEIRRLLTDLKENSEREKSELESRLASREKAQSESFRDIGLAVGRMGLGQVPSVESEELQPTGLDKKHYVLSLAERGLTSGEISRKLGLNKGETELVLGLKKYYSKQGTADEGRTVQ